MSTAMSDALDDGGAPSMNADGEMGLLQALEMHGWAIADTVVPAALVQALYRDSQAAWHAGVFHEAKVGRGASVVRDMRVRGDSICWLGTDRSSPAGEAFLAWAAQLRGTLNRHFYAGLRHEEFHFSHYPVGACYRRHLDRHRDSPHRQFSLVLYLNADWGADDGGELRLYAPLAPADVASAALPGTSLAVATVLPQCGRLVLFRSDLIPHEVLPCRRTRWALTGWFRTDAP